MPQLLERARLIAANSQASASKSPFPASRADADRAVRILAKSLFRQLKESGYENREILSLSTELVGLITSDLRPSEDPKP